MEKLKIKRLCELAKIPTRATEGSAGYDLYSANEHEITIKPRQTQKIPTGIAIELGDRGLCAFVYARSGIATKFGVVPANCVGVVDSDYRGEIIVFLVNHGDEAFTINCGDRIAQMVISPVVLPQIVVVDELSDTIRGGGGFGSTGN